MRRFRVSRRAITGMFLLALAGWTPPAVAGGAAATDKIPITTSSSEARELYLKGRELAEKLRATDARRSTSRPSPKIRISRWLISAWRTPPERPRNSSTPSPGRPDWPDGVSDGERHMVLGLDAAMKGDAAEVLSHYTELVRLFPNDERAHTLLGNLYFGRQDYDAAVKEFVRATAINPTFSQPYNQLGYAYRFVDKLRRGGGRLQEVRAADSRRSEPARLVRRAAHEAGPVRRVDQGLREGAVARCQLRRVVRGDRQQLPVRGPHRSGADGVRPDRGGRAEHGREAAGAFLDCGRRTSTRVPPTRRSTRCVRDTRSPRPSGIRPRCRAIWCRWATSCEKPARLDEASAKYAEAVKVIDQSQVPQPVKDAAHRNHVFEQGRVAVARGDLAAARTRSRRVRHADRRPQGAVRSAPAARTARVDRARRQARR